MEVRNESWRCETCAKLLAEHGVALALHDMQGSAVTGPVTADFVFVRRPGPEVRYHSHYPGTLLKRDAEHTRKWLSEGKDVFIYFNNDAHGYAVRNAQGLKELLESR